MANQRAAATKGTDEIVLSYHDSLLRASDLDLLTGPYWLNDVIIEFYYEYLTQQYQKENNARLMFVSPSLTQLLKLSKIEMYGTFLDAANAKSHDFVFFPVNNCGSRMNAGGTHWTLLVYSRATETCYHYDPTEGFSTFIAFNFADSLVKYFCKRKFLARMDAQYCEVPCPQQDNSYDCGLYVLCFTELISRQVLRGLEIKDCDLRAIPEMVKHKRTQLLNLIETLRTAQSNDN